MGTVIGQAALAAAIIFVAGAAPTRWLLPERWLAYWPFLALPVGFATLAAAADLLVLILPVQVFAWPLLILLAGVALACRRRAKEGRAWSRLDVAIVVGSALVAAGIVLLPALLEGRPGAYTVSNHDFFTYDVIADRLRARSYNDVDMTILVTHDQILEHYFITYVGLSWRLGLVNVNAIVATLLDEPAYRIFGDTLAVGYACWPLVLAVWAAIAGRPGRAAALAAPLALLSASVFYLVTEGFNAQLLSLTLIGVLGAITVDCLGSGDRRGLAVASLVAAGWLCIFADGAVFLAGAGAAIAVGVTLAGERPRRAVWRDVIGCATYAAAFAPWTMARGIRAAIETWVARVSWGIPFDESWAMPDPLASAAALLGSTADALTVPLDQVAPSTAELSIGVAAAATAMVLGSWGLGRPARYAAAALVAMGVSFSLAIWLVTDVGYLVGKVLISTSCFSAMLLAGAPQLAARPGGGAPRRWGLRAALLVAILALAGTVALSHQRRWRRPVTIAAEHEQLARLASRLPDTVQWVLLGHNTRPRDVIHEHALVYLFHQAGRPLLFHPNESSYLAWPGEWLPEVLLDPERLAFAVELKDRELLSEGEVAWESEHFRIRLLEPNSLIGRWEYAEGWYEPELDERGIFRWLDGEGVVQALATLPAPFARLTFEARVPEGTTMLEVLVDEQPVHLAPVRESWTRIETHPFLIFNVATIAFRVWSEPQTTAGRRLSVAIRNLDLDSTWTPPFSRLGDWRPGPGLGSIDSAATLRLWAPSQLVSRRGLRCVEVTVDAPGVAVATVDGDERRTLFASRSDLRLRPESPPAGIRDARIAWTERCPLPRRFTFFMPPTESADCAFLETTIEAPQAAQVQLLVNGTPVRGPRHFAAGRQSALWGPFTLQETVEVELIGDEIPLGTNGFYLTRNACDVSSRPSVWSDRWSEPELIGGALVRWSPAGVENAIVSLRTSSELACLALQVQVYCPPELAGTLLFISTAPTSTRGFVRGKAQLAAGWNSVTTETFPLEAPVNAVFVTVPPDGVEGRFGVGGIEIAPQDCPRIGVEP